MQRSLLLVPALILVAFLAGSCSSGEGPPHDRTSAIAAAVVRAVVTQGTNPAEVRAPVFVAPADPEQPISLEVQAGDVEALEDFKTLRFVDDPAEAIIEDDPGKPVVDGGILVELGPIPETGDTVVVDAKRYESEDEADDYRARVQRSGDTWTATLGASTTRAE